jgi:hypothetical protein
MALAFWRVMNAISSARRAMRASPLPRASAMRLSMAAGDSPRCPAISASRYCCIANSSPAVWRGPGVRGDRDWRRIASARFSNSSSLIGGCSA